MQNAALLLYFHEIQLLILFAEIKRIVDECEFDHMILGGDFNADFNRNSKFVSMVKDFIEKIDLERSWSLFPADFTHVSEIESKTYTSLIDHFFWNNNLSESVVDAGVIHVPENMSDHSPIFCKIKLSLINAVMEKKSHGLKNTIPKWNKANEEQKENYNIILSRKLEQINLSMECLNCRDVHCKAPHHISSLDEVMAQTLELIEKVAKEALNTYEQRSPRKGKLPNWKDDVDPVKDTAHFWNAVWKSAGKPVNCHLHSIMKRTRNRYHLEIRKKKRVIERMKHDKMLNSCLNKDGDIFKEIRKQRACKNSCPTSIDGRSKEIPVYLTGRYEQLYSQVN